MKKPKMIIFDYGQTLVTEGPFNALEGTSAVLKAAADNPDKVSTEDVQALADELNMEMARFGVDIKKQSLFEVHTHLFWNYLYEYFNIKLTKPVEEVEHIFEGAACKAEPTKNISELLRFLEESSIRTAVISNMSFSGELLKWRINKYIPSNKFEFIIASSEYVFRKPHKRIFELALRKAGLSSSDVWYCGDNAVFDIDGAANCGIFPLWYKGALDKTNKYTPEKEHLEINDWCELIGLLK